MVRAFLTWIKAPPRLLASQYVVRACPYRPRLCEAQNMAANRKETQMAKQEELPPPELNISGEKVCYIILKAREFDVKVDPVEPDTGSNPTDEDQREVIEDHEDDPTLAELKSAINDLNEDEIVDLIALAWVGRGDFGREG